MPNINKVEFGNQTLIDLTDATLEQSDGDKILLGETAYGRDGNMITGTVVTVPVDTAMSDSSENAVQNKVIKAYVDSHEPEIVTSGNWSWREYPNGTFEAWYKVPAFTCAINNASGSLYRSALQTLTLPAGLTNGRTADIIDATVNCGHDSYPAWTCLGKTITNNSITWYALSGGSRGQTNYLLMASVFGKFSS